MMQEVFFDRATTPHVQSWNELSAHQLLECMHVIYAKESTLRKLERLSAILCEIQPNQHLYISLEDAEAICAFLLVQDVSLTVNRFPMIQVSRWKKLYGPAEAMSNSSFGEFIMADSYCMNYIQTGKVEWLDKLIACLYRPKKANYDPSDVAFDGDIREGFNNNNLSSRLEDIGSLKLELKHALLTFFISSKNHFAATYTHLFVRGGKGNSSPWLDTLSAYANGVGNFEKVLTSNVGIVLYDLNRKVEKNKKLDVFV